MKVTIRRAEPADAEALLAIYAYYVQNTAVSFEYEVPSVAEFTERIRGTLVNYPYLVADDGYTLKEEYWMYDKLHPNPDAYVVMEGIIKPLIDQAIQ